MKPVDEIIPRTSEVQDTLNKFSLGIERAVNFGSNVIKWDLEATRGKDEKIPPILILRHFVELLDSISILIKSSSIDPNKVILRAMLEVYFGMDYLFEKDTDERSMAFLVCHLHKKLKVYKNLDPASTNNKQFLTEIQSDKSFDTLDLSRIPNIKDAILNTEAQLNLPIYQKAEAEYQRLISSKIKNPYWYQFFNGPINLRELAKHLKLSALYEILYRHWSGSTHSTDVIEGKILPSTVGGFDLIQIRYARDAQTITTYALTWSFKVFELFIKNRLPDRHHDYVSWYATMREFYLVVASKKQIINVID